MKYLVGQETCRSCGAKTVLVMRAVDDRLDPIECEACGSRAAAVAVWYQLQWPEVDALVRFDDERQRLKLPPLTDAIWQ